MGLVVASASGWKRHVEDLCKVLKQRIGPLRRIKHKVDQEKLQIIAEAIFTSKIRYGIAVYSNPRTGENETDNADIQKIQVLQNDMMRLINGHTRAEQVNMKTLRETHETLSVNQLTCYHIALEMHNVIWRNSSWPLKQKIQQLKDGSYRFRSESRGDLVVPMRPSRGCAGFSYKGPIIWNKMPKGLREVYEPEQFRKQLKPWIRTTIPD